MAKPNCGYQALILITILVVLFYWSVILLLSRQFCGNKEPETLDTNAELRMVIEKHMVRNVEEEIREMGWNRSLDDLVMERGGTPLRILLVGHMRSGSSFVGKLLQSHPGTLYIFEPFFFLDGQQIRSAPQIKSANSLLESLFHCKFNRSEDLLMNKYLQLTTRFPPRSHFAHCDKTPEVCFDVEFIARTCRSHPVQVIKTVRYRLDAVSKLLQMESLSNLRVVYLIRDPRAIMKSRLKLSMCKGWSECVNASAELCGDLAREFHLAQGLRTQFPHRFMVQSYEGMVKDYFGATKELFRFLGLKFMPSTSKFLQFEIRERIYTPFPYSLTTAAPDSIMTSNNVSLVKAIEDTCTDAIKLWGYK